MSANTTASAGAVRAAEAIIDHLGMPHRNERDAALAAIIDRETGAAALLAALEECADDLASRINAEYGDTAHYPTIARRRERDMAVVRQARAAIAKARGEA